jgi:hypothetical protein
MTDHRDLRDDLGRDPPEDLMRLAEHLRKARPLPTPAFRGRLWRHLEARSSRARPPARLGVLIGGCAAAGTLLLLVGTVSAAGAGPLGA